MTGRGRKGWRRRWRREGLAGGRALELRESESVVLLRRLPRCKSSLSLTRTEGKEKKRKAVGSEIMPITTHSRKSVERRLLVNMSGGGSGTRKTGGSGEWRRKRTLKKRKRASRRAATQTHAFVAPYRGHLPPPLSLTCPSPPRCSATASSLIQQRSSSSALSSPGPLYLPPPRLAFHNRYGSC